MLIAVDAPIANYVDSITTSTKNFTLLIAIGTYLL